MSTYDDIISPEAPGIWSPWLRQERGRIGGLAGARKRLEKQLHDVEVGEIISPTTTYFERKNRLKAKIAEIDRKLGRTRTEYGTLKDVTEEEEEEFNAWEFTKYYQYTSSVNSKHSRHFEIKIPLIFYANYTESDVEESISTVNRLADNALREAFLQAEYFETYNDFDELYADNDKHPLASSLRRGFRPRGGTAKGYENMGKVSRKINPKDAQEVTIEVDDKTDPPHYWKTTQEVKLYWTIPEKKK